MESNGNIQNSDWEGDEELKLDLQRYVLENLKRREIFLSMRGWIRGVENARETLYLNGLNPGV